MDSLPLLNETLDKIPNPETVEQLERLAGRDATFPSDSTLRLLADSLRRMDTMPSERTLLGLLEMAPTIKKLIPLLEKMAPYLDRIPSEEQVEALMVKMAPLLKFAEVMKGPGSAQS